MAIVIPSKYIFEPKSSKVKDNLIELLEVGAVEVVQDNDYETPVYNGAFSEVDAVINNKSGNEKYEADTSYAYEVWTAHVAYLSYTNQRFVSKDIYIKKNQNNHFVQSLILGKDKNDENNIKSSVYGYTKKGVATGEWEGTYKATGLQGELELNIGAINFNNETTDNEVKLFNLFDEYTFTWSRNVDFDKATVSVSLKAKDYSNLGEVSFSEETMDGEEYYKLSLLLMCGYRRVTMGAYNQGYTDSEENKKRTFSMNGNYIDYIPTKIEITIYGNTIGIDLQDKTVYCGDIDGKKTQAITSNELMQTSNKYEVGATTDLREGIDYTARIINDAPDGIPFAEIHISSFEEGSLYLISYKSDGYVYYKVVDRYSNTVDAGGYYIDWVKVYKFHPWYYGTQKAYQSGKETATITCAVSDYYDESGNKMISQDNNSLPMVFNLYDKVIPMVYGADGKDYPLSQKVNTAKVFQVLGIDFMYDGEPLQKLYLQEVTSEDY